MVTSEAAEAVVVGPIGVVVETPREPEVNRTITVEWMKAERRHLTSALMHAEYELGHVGLVCAWPRNGRDE